MVMLCIVFHIVASVAVDEESFLQDLFQQVQRLQEQGNPIQALKLLQEADKAVTDLKHLLLDRATASSLVNSAAVSRSQPSRCGDFSADADHSKQGMQFTNQGDHECSMLHFEVDAQKYGDSTAYYNFANALELNNKFDEAVEQWKLAGQYRYIVVIVFASRVKLKFKKVAQAPDDTELADSLRVAEAMVLTNITVGSTVDPEEELNDVCWVSEARAPKMELRMRASKCLKERKYEVVWNKLLHGYLRALGPHAPLSLPSGGGDNEAENVAPFKLRHDAQQLTYLLERKQVGGIEREQWERIVQTYTEVADAMDAGDYQQLFPDEFAQQIQLTALDGLRRTDFDAIQPFYNRATHLAKQQSIKAWRTKHALNPSLDFEQIQTGAGMI
jgi:hypothetical protein